MTYLFRFHWLGSVQVEQEGKLLYGFKSRKALALLGYLATEGRPVPRDYLANLFWPELTETRARNNLSQLLHNISTLCPGCLNADRYTVQFCYSATTWLDLKAFNELIAKGEVSAWGMATELYRGDFMSGMYLDDCPEFEQWLRLEQETWRQRVTQVLHDLVAQYESCNELDQALQFSSRLLSIDPGDEEGHRQKMVLLAQSGQRSAALAQFEACRHFLAEELGVEPAKETIKLYEQIRAGELNQGAQGLESQEIYSPKLSPPPATDSLTFNNLPLQATSFIGRETELAIIDKYLANPTCRLVTIIGLGGIGKTRLALQAASVTSRFRHGVCFIPLTATNSAEFLVAAIADALNFPFYRRGDQKAQLMHYLSDKEMLLVMDNFEHLVTGAGLVIEILQHAPRVKVLVTSRERLNLREEWVLDLQGLPFPENAHSARMEDFGAVQLFLQRAQQVQADFWLRYLDKPAIVQICCLVEGLPLGIELAAAWTRTFSCQDISAEIEKNYSFLTTALQNMPKRHQSLRAVFEHSWKLLSEEERTIFRKLSVFWGSCSRRSGEQVVGASALLLSALVDKSLLRWTSADRYEIHELLRQYAAEKLAENPEEKKIVKDKHCQYYAEFLGEQEARLKRGHQQEALEAINLEIDNVRAGWFWAITHNRIGEIRQYLEGLFLFYNLQSRFQEGEAVFRQAAATLRQHWEKAGSDWETAQMLGQVLARQGVFCASLGQYDQARAIMREGLAIFEDVKLGQSSPLGLNYLGAVAWALGEYVEAQRLCRQGLELAQKMGDRWKEAWILEYLGMIAISLGEYQEAKAIAQKSLVIFRQFGYCSGVAFSLNMLGIAARNLGEYREAKQLCQESLQIARKIGDRWEEALSLEYLSMTAMSLGEYEEAKAMAQRSLVIFRGFGYRSGIAFCLNLLGTAARNLGEYTKAKRLHQAVLRICQEQDYSLGIALTSYYLGRTAHLLGDHLEAKRLLTDSLTMAKQLAYQRGVTQSLNALGSVAYALGEYQEAKNYLVAALKATQEIWAVPITLDILTGFANLLSGEGKITQAMELLAFPLNHAASKKETRDKAGRILKELSSKLPSQVIASVQEKGRNGQLEEVVKQILNGEASKGLPIPC
jgi:predicted ATPase/DNA-binding SARP family transcriptional activator